MDREAVGSSLLPVAYSFFYFEPFCAFAFCRCLHGAMPPWRCVRHRTTCLQLSGTTFLAHTAPEAKRCDLSALPSSNKTPYGTTFVRDETDQGMGLDFT